MALAVAAPVVAVAPTDETCVQCMRPVHRAHKLCHREAFEWSHKKGEKSEIYDCM
jgi:hypothetical protein